MTVFVDEIRLGPGDGPSEIVRRLIEWSRRVTQRFAETPQSQVVPLTFDPSDLPIELAVSGPRPPAAVALHSAIAVDAQEDTISGGSVTWSVQSGFVRISAVSALSGGTSYEARFEVKF